MIKFLEVVFDCCDLINGSVDRALYDGVCLGLARWQSPVAWSAGRCLMFWTGHFRPRQQNRIRWTFTLSRFFHRFFFPIADSRRCSIPQNSPLPPGGAPAHPHQHYEQPNQPDRSPRRLNQFRLLHTDQSAREIVTRRSGDRQRHCGGTVHRDDQLGLRCRAGEQSTLFLHQIQRLVRDHGERRLGCPLGRSVRGCRRGGWPCHGGSAVARGDQSAESGSGRGGAATDSETAEKGLCRADGRGGHTARVTDQLAGLHGVAVLFVIPAAPGVVPDGHGGPLFRPESVCRAAWDAVWRCWWQRWVYGILFFLLNLVGWLIDWLIDCRSFNTFID